MTRLLIWSDMPRRMPKVRKSDGTMHHALLSLFTAASLLPRFSLAHWQYTNLIVEGEVIGEPYQYVRQSNVSDAPLQIVNSTTMRCNSGGSSGTALGTQTLTVRAGAELGFKIASTFGHPGVQQVYVSKAPRGVSAADYDGSGGWVKIYAASYRLSPNSTAASPEPAIDPQDGIVWATAKMHSFRFPLPAELPEGEYLIRAEGLALHAAHKLDQAQFYVGCAQVIVESLGGTDSVGPLVEFPGAYDKTSPGVLIPDFWTKIRNYTMPGPGLWPEGTEVQHDVKTLDGEASQGSGRWLAAHEQDRTLSGGSSHTI